MSILQNAVIEKGESYMRDKLLKGIRQILMALIVFAVLLILAKKIVEPAFSDLITQPISENIAKKASDYLEIPPTTESFNEFVQDAYTNDWIDPSGQLNLQYEQLPHATEGTITVSYSETFLRFMNLHSTADQTIHYLKPHEKELVVSTMMSSEDSMSAVLSAENTTAEESTAEENTAGKNEPEENVPEKSATNESTEQLKPIKNADQKKETVHERESENEPETKSLTSSNDSEHTLPNEDDASDHGVALYVDGKYFDAFVSKEDALALAVFVENAKIIDLVTNRVVWESAK